MSKEDNFVLRGKLVRKPRPGFSYARTRKIIVEKLLSFEFDDKKNHLFERVGNLKIEEEKFDLPIKINKHAYGTAKDELQRQIKICELLEMLEKHFGIGAGEGKDEAEQIKNQQDADKRLAEMERMGVIPISFITEFEEKEFDS